MENHFELETATALNWRRIERLPDGGWQMEQSSEVSGWQGELVLEKPCKTPIDAHALLVVAFDGPRLAALSRYSIGCYLAAVRTTLATIEPCLSDNTLARDPCLRTFPSRHSPNVREPSPHSAASVACQRIRASFPDSLSVR